MKKENLTCPVSRIKTDVVKKIRTDVVRRLRTDVVQRPKGWAGEAAGFAMETPYLKIPVERIFHHIRLTDVVNGYRQIIADPRCEWVKDFLCGEEWNPGECVFLGADCSTGKNTYVEHLVNSRRYDRILILANRRANKQQIMERLGIADDRLFQGAEVRTYQSLEQDHNCWSRELDHYGLIVVDEAHYFICDSLFNPQANISLEKILGTQYPVKLFMSATITEVAGIVMGKLRKKYDNLDLAKKCSVYQMSRNKQNITSVNCVDLHEVIKKIDASNEKWMIFVDSKELGKMITSELGEKAVFISSESSTDDPEAKAEYDHITRHECFKHQVLVATSVLDNGINIKDRKVKNVVIAHNDRIELVQMLGRKRCIDENDSFDLYLLYTDKDDIVKALQLNRKEQQQWLDTQNYLGSNDGFPPFSYSLNSEEGKAQREIIYMNEQKRKFAFNWLGFRGLKTKEAMLMELAKANDIFQAKLDWIFKGHGIPPVGSSEQDVIGRRIVRIMDAVKPFMQRCYPVKSAGFKSFREVFSRTLWENFTLDKEEHHRPDRILKAAKINAICRRLGIPIELEKTTIKRKTCYTIKKQETFSRKGGKLCRKK